MNNARTRPTAARNPPRALLLLLMDRGYQRRRCGPEVPPTFARRRVGCRQPGRITTFAAKPTDRAASLLVLAECWRPRATRATTRQLSTPPGSRCSLPALGAPAGWRRERSGEAPARAGVRSALRAALNSY